VDTSGVVATTRSSAARCQQKDLLPSSLAGRYDGSGAARVPVNPMTNNTDLQAPNAQPLQKLIRGTTAIIWTLFLERGRRRFAFASSGTFCYGPHAPSLDDPPVRKQVVLHWDVKRSKNKQLVLI
jgi:hypothetical protein